MDFLTNLHIMDYSLLLGVHNCEAEDQETDPRSGDELDDEEYDSGGSGVALTPPDSPLANRPPTADGQGGKSIALKRARKWTLKWTQKRA